MAGITKLPFKTLGDARHSTIYLDLVLYCRYDKHDCVFPFITYLDGIHSRSYLNHKHAAASL